MDGQLSFATLDYAGKKKRTKRDAFLAEMAAAVPWSVLDAVIAPHYPKEGPQGGRRAFPIAVMLRIYCLQQWYNLSDPGAEEALYDIQSMRAFCNLELGRDPIPDETTILNFRHLLEAHELTKTVFEAVAEYLEARGAGALGNCVRCWLRHANGNCSARWRQSVSKTPDLAKGGNRGPRRFGCHVGRGVRHVGLKAEMVKIELRAGHGLGCEG